MACPADRRTLPHQTNVRVRYELVAAAEIIAPAKVALAEAAKRKALRVTPTNAAQ